MTDESADESAEQVVEKTAEGIAGGNPVDVICPAGADRPTQASGDARLVRWHSIREASTYSGLPESTLRYYEQIGLIPPIVRDPSSGHRAYTDDDLQALSTIACLSATGMSLAQMRDYMANRSNGGEGAGREIELLRGQQKRLDEEQRFLAVRSEYVALKIRYWQAVQAGDIDQAAHIGSEASAKIGALRQRGSTLTQAE
ncbi:MerR family transcriptional regulator [Bifidobacterium subtile]|uniref:MerR family transcriptional regulator n=1 Tax=Bifidobacterium subtile TaxID=77635 RepID=UPI002F3561DC